MFIKGNFKKYIFKSDKGYVVGLLKVKDCSLELDSFKNKVITFTGYFSDLNESDLYLLNGELTNHERYGEQFNVSSYEMVLPDEKDNIIDFLSSNLFPGIGVSKATKIVEVLGNNCLDIILNNPDSLYLVPKITKKQKETIEENLLNQSKSYKIVVNLTKYGFTTKDALLIYHKYKDKTLDKVNLNVYDLIDDIYEITFKKIEQVRTNFNIKDSDLRRVKFGIKYFIDEASYIYGSTYFTKEEIVFLTKKGLLLYDDNLINDCLNTLVEEQEIIKIDDKYFLKKMYQAESSVSKYIFNLANKDVYNNVYDKDLKELESYFNISYNDDQKLAIKSALSNNFLVITGGPGTGKTTIIKAICKLYQSINNYTYEEMNKKLALLAPTGRASKRISEQTSFKASTIHRFLKWNKEDNTFNINKNNKSDVNFIIIDEVSMVDIYLLQSLFEGIYSNTKIVLIGDYNQLPSVGPGQVLKDIIDSDCVNVIKLNKLYRQEETSNINLFAHNINNGIVDMDVFNKKDDLLFIKANSLTIKDEINKYALKYQDYDFNNFIILSPMYKGDNGIDNLNYNLQDLLNKNTNSISINGVIYKEKDKVLQLVNMVDDNVFNGDIGKIIKIKNSNPKEIIIDYDDNFVRFTPANFNNFSLGYTISIHKAQGSEFDIVILPILKSYSFMLYRKLIYTAVTRAKKKLVLVGEEEVLKLAILNNKEDKRKTYLKDFIISCIK